MVMAAEMSYVSRSEGTTSKVASSAGSSERGIDRFSPRVFRKSIALLIHFTRLEA